MIETWLAYSLDEELPAERVERALDRVAGHYQEAVTFPLMRRGRASTRWGMVIWAGAESSREWPAWSEAGELAIATAYVPTGWERLVGARAPSDAVTSLGRALQSDPARVGELNSPLLVGICDAEADRLTIINDQIGVARLYEMPFDGGCVWSNRLGALPIFAGVAPEADHRGWALLAAGGWFMSDSTPIRGARKVPAGTAITVDRSGVARRQTEALHGLVAPRAPRLAAEVDASAEQAAAVLRAVSELWGGRRLDIDLSGGRDSRVSAAAAVAGRIDAILRTTEELPGETEIARQLVAASPHPMKHVVRNAKELKIRQPLRERAMNNHLVYDGIAAPQAVRRSQRVLNDRAPAPTIAGYGGGIAHGAPFYSRQPLLDRIREQGDTGPLRRLMKFCRRKHEAARDEVYEIARSDMKETLAAGRRHGIEGPSLLDYFLLVDRFAFKTGLSKDSATFSVFTTPAFIRAAFDLTPEQRLESLLHRRLIGRLVPEWTEIPFHRRQAPTEMPKITRPRLWDTIDGESVDEMLADDSAWSPLFHPDRLRAMWAEVKAGQGHSHHEQVFERLIWRQTYEDHLARLGRRATEDPESGGSEALFVTSSG